MSAKVSIVTVVFNGAKAMEATIKSVLNQSYSPIEYIIVDGGSSDGTQAIIEKYSNHIAKYISEKDTGIYDAMNKGVKMATGEWVNFMNCGDTFHDNKIVQNIFEKNRDGFDFIYGDYIADYSHKGQRLIKASLPQPPHQMVLSHQSVFARTAALLKFPFDTQYRISADLKFYEQCWHHELKFHYFPQVISIRSHAGLSEVNRSLAFKETEQVLFEFYDHDKIKRLMQRIKVMHLIKHGAKKILPAFLQRIYRRNL